MSSDAGMDTNPPAAPNSTNLPCMFTVEQFQLAAPSQEPDSEPSSVYIVRPTAIWNSLQRFKRSLIADEQYRLHDIVTAARHDLPESPLWLAHVLEIRGHPRSGRAFIRVFWFYQPSQLPPSLRHPYHGRRELLASNAMAVIDGTAVAGRAHVAHWNEEHEEAPAAGPFWRQTYDVQTQSLGPLHTPCPPPCIQHHNPDSPLIACPSPTCTARMHKPCILAATLHRLQIETEARGRADGADADADAAARDGKRKKRCGRGETEEEEGASLRVEWMEDEGGGSAGYGALVTEGRGAAGDRGGRCWVEEVRCLGCGGVMR